MTRNELNNFFVKEKLKNINLEEGTNALNLAVKAVDSAFRPKLIQILEDPGAAKALKSCVSLKKKTYHFCFCSLEYF